MFKNESGPRGLDGGGIEITIVGDRLLEYAGYISLVQVHSGARSHDDAKGDVPAFLGAVLHSDFGAHSEFACNSRLAIDRELHAVHALVLAHLYGEFPISHGGEPDGDCWSGVGCKLTGADWEGSGVHQAAMVKQTRNRVARQGEVRNRIECPPFRFLTGAL